MPRDRRLSQARLKPPGFGVGTLPALVEGHASSQRDLVRFARVAQPAMA